MVSAEQALPPEIAALCRAVADRYGGVLADVLRLALPPRHARVEAEATRAQGAATSGGRRYADRCRPARRPDAGGRPTGHGDAETAQSAVGGLVTDAAAAVEGGRSGWGRYPRGRAFLRALGEGRAAHAVWQALPGEAWAERLADAAQATVGAGRGALLVVPDQRDVELLHAACAARLGAEAVVALTADLGPAERYRRWLAVRRGLVRVVVGTRSAAFAPVAEPGLLAVWDDGDDLHAEPRAPYPHVRDVLVLRAHAVGAALLVGGYARTAEGQLLVESGWASEIVADRATVRAAMPRVVAQGESDLQLARDPLARAARLPSAAFEAARAALAAGGPVLVQTPRAGYVPWLVVRRVPGDGPLPPLRGPAGPPRPRGIGTDRAEDRAQGQEAAAPSCRWCGRVESAYRCGACGSRRLRAGVVGSRRTAEELGRAFPGVPVRISGGGAAVLSTVARPRRDRGRHPGRGAARRVRRRAAARRLGPARPAGPAGSGGDAAPVDGGRGPGRAAHRRRSGARHGRPRPAVGAGPGALGPGRARRRRARRPRRGRASRPRCGWPRSTPHRPR